MIQKITVLLLLMNSFSLFLFSQNEKEVPKDSVNPNASKILDQVSEAVKTYDAKKQKFQEDVLSMFDKKETISRSKGDIKILNQLKNEKDNFLKEGKDPTLFFITDQKRSLELAKLSLIKSYEKHIKECLTLKFDFEADELVKELETLKNEKAEYKFKPNIKTNAPPINKNNIAKDGSFDPLQSNSVWINDKKTWILTITERKGESFKALWEQTPAKALREVNGKIKGPSIIWLSKDTLPIRNTNAGGDHFGTLKKDDTGYKIDFKFEHPPNGLKGAFTLWQEKQ